MEKGGNNSNAESNDASISLVKADDSSSGTVSGSEQSLAKVHPDQELLAVRISVFEGPLDLLLHLVREHRLDIFDIPISFITNKYLEVIERMRELNLDVAGEFLVMAATLAHIKSRMLLPKPEMDDCSDEDGGDIDPRADLVRRLLEYQKYREAGESLGRQDILNRDVFVRQGQTDIPEADGETGFRQVGVFRLIEALDAVLARAKVDVAHEVIRERFSLSERLTQVVELISSRRRMTFRELFEGEMHRQAIVMTFLALLEMSRLGLASIVQEDVASEIFIVALSEGPDSKVLDIRDDFA